jgi:hypothetical protein
MRAMSELQKIVDTFTSELVAMIEAQATAQARAAVLTAFGAGAAPGKRRGRPPKALAAAAAPAPAKQKKARKKAPLQICPVPGCKNPAAPVFGMVCAKHKDLPKAKIKQFREARRAKKLGVKPSKVATKTAKKIAKRKIKKPAAKVAPARKAKVVKRKPKKGAPAMPIASAEVATPPAAT